MLNTKSVLNMRLTPALSQIEVNPTCASSHPQLTGISF